MCIYITICELPVTYFKLIVNKQTTHAYYSVTRIDVNSSYSDIYIFTVGMRLDTFGYINIGNTKLMYETFKLIINYINLMLYDIIDSYWFI